MTQNKRYWDGPITSKQKKDLDLDLIDEINELYPEKSADNEVDESKKGKSLGLRLIGLLTVVVFLSIFLGNFLQFYNMPSLDFLSRSRQLTQIEEVNKLREAVVIVNTVSGRGTGFNIDPSGLVITNHHVIEDKRVIFVNFLSNDIYGVNKIDSFPDIDLAVANISGENLPTLEIEKNKVPQAGDEVLIIGNPLGFSYVVKEGQVAGEIKLKNWDEQVLMIKGPIYKGSSGSPVFSAEGKVVAVIFATLVTNNNEEIIGLAVPIKHLLDRLETD